MKSRTFLFILLISLSFLSFRCSSAIDPPIVQTAIPSPGLLSAYELTINAENSSAELTPIRQSSLGESFLISGLSYFSSYLCPDCLKLKSLAITSEGYIQITFEIRHPLQPGNPANPPSGRNRLDLDIFDPAIIIVPLEKTPSNFTQTNASIYDSICADADGYTNELANLITDPAAFPYYLIVDDDADGTNTFNEFPMGAQKSFSVLFDITGTVQLDLYLTFGYGVSAAFYSRLYPQYYNPEFNRKNAWKVSVIPPEGSSPPHIGNTWSDDDSTTTYKVTVKVWDWQHGVTTIVNPPIQSGDIAFASNVASVSVEIPGMTNSLPTATDPVSGIGRDPADPLIYEFNIANENLLPEGAYISLVKVLDQRVPAGTTGVTDSLGHSPDGASLSWHLIPEYATYQTFTATVHKVSCEETTVLVSGQRSGIHEEYTAVIHTQTEWEAFWILHDSINPPPTVDFDNYMVVAICLGGVGSSGFYVTTDCVELVPGFIGVVYTKHIPGYGCITMPVFCYPFQFVTVKKWDGAADFTHLDSVYDC